MGKSETLLYLSVGFSIFFFLVGNVLTKTIPIWLLAVAIYLQPSHSHSIQSKAIGIGLMLSSVGDIFLALVDDFNAPCFFIPGLVSFLIAHIIYMVGMFVRIESKSLYLIPVVVFYYLYLISKLLPTADPELTVPVLVYGAALCTMTMVAINRVFSNAVNRQSALLGLFGSLLFLASDSILALNKFHAPILHASRFVMITYYLAQILLTASVLTTSATLKR